MDERYVATKHWQHLDWTVYDTARDEYRIRGLIEIEAIEAADRFNRQVTGG